LRDDQVVDAIEGVLDASGVVFVNPHRPPATELTDSSYGGAASRWHEPELPEFGVGDDFGSVRALNEVGVLTQVTAAPQKTDAVGFDDEDTLWFG
jgi:hypothetical protein